MVEVEYKLEEAVHFVLLDYSCLAERAKNLDEGLPLLNFKLFDSNIRHLYYHDIVA